MSRILTVLFLHVSVHLSGQTMQVWHNANFAIDTFSDGLPAIEKSVYNVEFRLLLGNQIVEFHSDDRSNFDGSVTNSIKQIGYVKTKEGSNPQASKIHIQTIAIDSITSTRLARKILQSGQAEIPTDSLIPSWVNRYLHCGSIAYQFKLDDNYSKKSFHCPWNQPDSTEYKDIIIANYNLLVDSLKLTELYDKFMQQLPKGKTYSRNGYSMMYLYTEKQKEALNKDQPRRDYLKLVRDTIDDYLRSEIEKKKEAMSQIGCFQSYRLVFSSNGRLKSVKVSSYDKPALKKSIGFGDYVDDIREVSKCKSAIRKILKYANLNTLNKGYKVYRSLSVNYTGEIQLIDNMIY